MRTRILNLKKTTASLISKARRGYMKLFFNENGILSAKDNLGNVTTVGGSAPNYVVWESILTQTGTDAPVADVKENTTAIEPVINYDTAGFYSIDFSELTTDATRLTVLTNSDSIGTTGKTAYIKAESYTNDGRVYLYCSNGTELADSLLKGFSIQVKIWNA